MRHADTDLHPTNAHTTHPSTATASDARENPTQNWALRAAVHATYGIPQSIGMKKVNCISIDARGVPQPRDTYDSNHSREYNEVETMSAAEQPATAAANRPSAGRTSVGVVGEA
jgi:hypothetical protein